MKTNNTIIAGAALAGILTGGFAFGKNTTSSSSDDSSMSAGIQAADEKGETHDCKGKNSCKGKGGCKGGDNGCAGKNSCKGKGGCAMKDGKPVKKDK
ncbi:hypothetical protein OKA05_18285 [Luteolibacter arcticus]|uniref:Low-complexity protein n=1 Tax=Luteolibacter arcticus TaxID=1581411 RepID=A0ABT3GLX0_9BACT|nr:hypothetical protein [Luteolibacter arcticus]MCW1924520.1 hypothetical protein [Luteolibacter arcticus]